MRIGYRRILVTGAGGFVGRHLIARLVEACDPATRIFAADRHGGSNAGALHVPFDLLDPVSVDAAIARTAPDLVFHLAGQSSVAGANSAEIVTWRTNVTGSLELALALNAHAPTALLIFASTAEVYGHSFAAGPVDEATIPEPASIYGKSKLVAEATIGAVRAPEGPVIIVRPSNHVGPGQDERFALPSFAAQIACAEGKGEAAEIRVGNLAAERDFMDVRDVVDAYLAIADIAPRTAPRTVLNLSSGVTRSLQSLLDDLRLIASVPTNVRIDADRFRAVDIAVAAIRSDRVRTLTGWSAKRSVSDTLADILTAAREMADQACAKTSS